MCKTVYISEVDKRKWLGFGSSVQEGRATLLAGRISKAFFRLDYSVEKTDCHWKLINGAVDRR